jgi:hypothetical protein
MRANLLTASLTLTLFASFPALSQQHLIPTPYPAGHNGARLLPAPPSSRHQVLIPSPYPHALGPNALGNPRIGKVRRHQRLMPAPYPRQSR